MRYFIVLLILSGCATAAKFEKNLNSWVGTSEESLIARWGVPSSSYAINDSTHILRFDMNNGTTVNNIYGTLYAVQHSCTVNFTVKDGAVSNWSYEGNSCKSD